jgi:hypothetical protein
LTDFQHIHALMYGQKDVCTVHPVSVWITLGVLIKLRHLCSLYDCTNLIKWKLRNARRFECLYNV